MLANLHFCFCRTPRMLRDFNKICKTQKPHSIVNTHSHFRIKVMGMVWRKSVDASEIKVASIPNSFDALSCTVWFSFLILYWTPGLWDSIPICRTIPHNLGQLAPITMSCTCTLCVYTCIQQSWEKCVQCL